MSADKQWQEVNAAFTQQSSHFDEDDTANRILQLWRNRIYEHVEKNLRPNSTILELNAGTGIDAVHFARQGHQVHATDLSDGMVEQIKEKVKRFSLQNQISVQQVSFQELDQIRNKFDFIFSNFGGLNCTDDLRKITERLPDLLNKNGFVTWVIMPRVCPWEWLWLLKGKYEMAFRRLNRGGTKSHLEGHHFLTYYYSLEQIADAMPAGIELLKSESLGCFAPPPAAIDFVKVFPKVTSLLNATDIFLTKKFPFNRWGDHLIVTFRVSKQ